MGDLSRGVSLMRCRWVRHRTPTNPSGRAHPRASMALSVKAAEEVSAPVTHPSMPTPRPTACVRNLAQTGPADLFYDEKEAKNTCTLHD